MFGSTAAEKDSTVVEVTRKDRRDLWASVTVFVVLAVAVIWRYVSTLVGQLSDGTVSAHLQLSGDSVPRVATPVGAEVEVGQVTSMQIPTGDLSPVTAGFLRAGDLVESVGYLVVLALLTALVVRFMRGGIFEQRTAKLVNVAAIGAVIAVFLPAVPRTLGGNMVGRDLGWPGSDVRAAALSTEFWPIYVFCMAFSAVAVIVKIGARMARDQAGLV